MSSGYFEIEYVNSGKREKKVIKASSKTEALVIARDTLNKRIIKAKEVNAPLFDSFSLGKIKLGGKKITLDSLISAIRQITVMANAGMSFTDILQETIGATENERLREILTQNLNDINAGLSFSNSMRKFENEVGAITVTMIELGERTGTMAESLNTLAEILEEIRTNRLKIKKALSYPIFVVLAMIIGFTILIMMVVPKFKKLFEKFGAELPLPTRILLNMEWFLSNYGLFLLGAVVIVVFVIKYLHRNNDSIRLRLDDLMLRLPIIGIMLKLALIGRFTLVFKELNKAGLPIIEALNIAAKGVENSHMRKQLLTVSVNVQRGLSLTASLKETKIYENMIIQMLSAGEQSGSLGSMLDKTADYYRQKFQYKMDNLSTALEPILLAGIAGFVLLMALGIFMPMWEMGSAVKKGAHKSVL